MSLAYLSYVNVCHLYVLVCTRMLSIGHAYVLVAMSFVCHSYVVLQ